ncbi:MAG: oxaloacetate decarboxylase subunit alpha [bacterium]
MTTENKSIEFIDTSLRDGHQSLLATRMSTAQSLRVLPLLRDAGYHILELWGGATLDAALRFTGDDPFERLEQFREVLGPSVAIRSLCRGQNLFGYSPYPDEVVERFLRVACELGNDRIRIFDALNDARNLSTAIDATKAGGSHAEVALSYTTSPVHDLDHFVRFARSAVELGADSLAIKDMAGLLHPAVAWELIEQLKDRFPDMKLTLHTQTTNGLANATAVVGMLAGVDYIDTGHGPLAGGTALPPVELMQYFADALGRETNVDRAAWRPIHEQLLRIRRELRDSDASPEQIGRPWAAQPSDEVRRMIERALELLQTRDRSKAEEAIQIIEYGIMVPQGYPPPDPKQLESQIPGGMLSNLHKQLKEQGALDRLPEIVAAVPQVREDAGWVPLVTPTSQIVGSQAAFNVLTGRHYGFISKPFANLVMGKYGRTPGPVNPDVLKKCSRGREQFTDRPAVYAEPVDLDAVRSAHADIIRRETDLMLIVLFEGPASTFLQERQAA